MPLAPIVALEIGTSRVRALVGEQREDGCLMVTGIGECPSRGVRKGEITDFDNALACVENVLKVAEEQSKVDVRQVHVVLSGQHMQGAVNRGTTPIIPPDSEITETDMEAVVESARTVSLPPERMVLHSIRQQFYVDDLEGVSNPEGMVGARLAVSMLILHGVRNRILDVLKVASSAGVETAENAFGGLCAALAVLSPEQKESGCLLIDMGGGTTDYVVYANRCIALAGSIGVGGDHITNDVSMVLRIPSSSAEKLKMDMGVAVPGNEPPDQPVIIPPSGGYSGKTLRSHDVNAIISVRLEETLELVHRELVKHDLVNRMGAGVILTGGGAHLKNVCPFASSVLQLPCEIGRPRNVSGISTATEGPEYAATVGMLRYGILHGTREARTGGFLTIVSRLLGR